MNPTPLTDEEVAAQTEKHKRNTFLVLCFIGGIAGAWEIWTIVNRWIGDTESAVMSKLADDQPAIAFAHGMLGGHLYKGLAFWAMLIGIPCGKVFWPLRDGEETE